MIARCTRIIRLSCLWALLLSLPDPAALFAQPPSTRSVPESLPAQPVVTPRIPNGDARPPDDADPTAADPIDTAYRLLTGRNELQARVLGASQLLTHGGEQALERLVRAVQDSTDAEAPMAVCRAVALVEAPPAELLTPLVNLVGDARPGLSEAAVLALRRFDTTLVLARLRDIAQDVTQRESRRLDALRAIAAWADDIRAVQALVAMSQAEATNSLRPAVLDVLGQALGSTFADAEAVAAWWDKNKSITQEDWLRRRNELLRSQIRRLTDSQVDLVRRMVALCRESYVRAPEQERPRILLSFLKDAIPSVRQLGLELVNLLVVDRSEIDPEIRAQLGVMIADPSSDLRAQAAKVVGDLRLAAESPRLIEAIGRETAPDTRAAQVAALGRLGGDDAAAVLIARLDDGSSRVVGEAAGALGELAGQSRDAPEPLKEIKSALLRRFESIDVADVELRQRFLKAMAQIGGEEFRPVFIAEIAADRPSQVRQSAIRGLSIYADPAVSDLVRPLVTATQPAIRQTAVAALGASGRTRDDLRALGSRLDSKSEPDATVRQEAWDAYRAIAGRMPPPDQLAIAAEFDVAGDKVAQQRRLDLLRALEPGIEQLKPAARADVYEAIGDAKVALGEPKSAANRYQQALAALGEQKGERVAALHVKIVKALLADGNDAAALQAVDHLLANGDARADASAVASALETEIQNRLRQSNAAAAHQLTRDAAARANLLGADFRERLAPLARQAETLLVDQLVGQLGSDPEASRRLTDLGPSILPSLCAKLTANGATSRNGPQAERRLVEVIRTLIPEWSGFAADAAAETRAAALAELDALIARRAKEVGASDVGRVSVPTNTTTAPAPVTSTPPGGAHASTQPA